jgi:hypothetical protein
MGTVEMPLPMNRVREALEAPIAILPQLTPFFTRNYL